MNIVRLILSGTLAWSAVFTAFLVFSFIPALKDDAFYQAVAIVLLVLPIATLSAGYYYKKGNRTHGLAAGIIMVGTALLLDVLITVPLVEIPYNGSSYAAFFTNPLLWMLVTENVLIIYFYWKVKIFASGSVVSNGSARKR